MLKNDVPPRSAADIEARKQLAARLVPRSTHLAREPTLGRAQLVVEVTPNQLAHWVNSEVGVRPAHEGTGHTTNTAALHAIRRAATPLGIAGPPAFDHGACKILGCHHSDSNSW